MKRTTFVFVAVLALLFAGAASLSAQNKVLDFKLVNKTGVDIEKLFISAADVNEWEEDVLGVDVLEDGDTVEIKFDANVKTKIWDLKIEDGEGTAVIWENLDLSKVNVLTLKIVNGKPIAEIK